MPNMLGADKRTVVSTELSSCAYLVHATAGDHHEHMHLPCVLGRCKQRREQPPRALVLNSPNGSSDSMVASGPRHERQRSGRVLNQEGLPTCGAIGVSMGILEGKGWDT